MFNRSYKALYKCKNDGIVEMISNQDRKAELLIKGSIEAKANTMNLLNLGCGSRFHPSWTNIDFFRPIKV